MSIIPENFIINKAEDVIHLFELLLIRNIDSEESFEQFLLDVSELESHISEDFAWRYIHNSCDTMNKDYEKQYLFFIQEVQPLLAPFEDKINNKIINCRYCGNLEKKNTAYSIYFRNLRGAVEIFREENIPIQAELATLAQEYGSVQGAMSVTHENQEYTMQQASNFLLKTDRDLREKIWRLMFEKRNENTEKLENIFDKMVALRHQMAVNAGFSNYRDYMFKALGRYDYSVQDCFDFHTAIEKNVVPILKEITSQRKENLNLSQLKPWDLSVDSLGREPLKPFETGEELLNKTIDCFNALDPYFSNCISTMKEKKLLDLDSRKGKAPGGYNYPLAKTNMPFIFMNASGNLRDVETMVHEGGHAIHSFLMAPLKLNSFKNTPSEVAELASMSMELISMHSWEIFLQNNELMRAKLEQLEGIISTLPWIATVDCFQHWIYENPNHSREERKTKWIEINKRFGTGLVDYSGIEEALNYSWHKQLHIFEVPFYYIEYGFAQLGAIGVWKNCMQNLQLGLNQYKSALTLGYTKPIKEIYKTAGVEFNFSGNYVDELFAFVKTEMSELKN